MSITMSPVDDIGGLASGGSGGGGTGVGRPWWDFPAPPGAPKPGSIPGACWHQQVAKTGERYWQPVMCNGGVSYPPGTQFPSGVPWQEWFGGP
jgi:hypothetical protein